MEPRLVYVLQQSLNALQLGSIYALIALGYTMVYGVLTMINFAHDDIFMVGAFLCFGGEELVGQAPHAIARLGVARTFQNIRLFRDLTVIDNVRTALDGHARYGAFEALGRFGRFGSEERRTIAEAHELLALLKLDHLAGEAARNLPYGLQRRLEIARALALRPRLLLLDEPAAGMNPNEIGQLMELIAWVRTPRGSGFWGDNSRGHPRRGSRGPESARGLPGRRGPCRASGGLRVVSVGERLLEVRGLGVAYGGIRAVRDVSFEVRRGEIVTLIGGNGAGKSSILRAISGLVPREGTVTYDDRDLAGPGGAWDLRQSQRGGEPAPRHLAAALRCRAKTG